MMKNLMVIAVALAALSAPALAQQPGHENDALKPFLGRWRCDDVTKAGMNGADVKVKSAYTFKTTLNGFWSSAVFEQKKTKGFPGFQAHALFGWDAAQNKYVLVGFDSEGSWIELTAAAAGDTIEWTGEAHGQNAAVPFKFTWTKSGAKAAMFLIEVTPPGAAGPVKISEATCKAR